MSSRGREKAQWLGTCTVLAEDLSSTSSFLIKQLINISSRSFINSYLQGTDMHMHTPLLCTHTVKDSKTNLSYIKDKFKMSGLDIWCDCCAWDLGKFMPYYGWKIKQDSPWPHNFLLQLWRQFPSQVWCSLDPVNKQHFFILLH